VENNKQKGTDTVSKLLLSIAALIAALSLAWTAYNGVQIRHTGSINSNVDNNVDLHTDKMFMYLSHDGYIGR
jgi:hypothetical protein